jgi:hypothetical protein
VDTTDQEQIHQEHVDNEARADVDHTYRSIRAVYLAALTIILGILCAAVMFVTLYLNPLLEGLDDQAKRSRCSLTVNGETWQAIAESLDAPPASGDPASERAVAVQNIKDQAERFDNCK